MLDVIMVVLVKKRTDDAPKLQEVFTEHGCIIKTRIGIHEVSQFCSEDGLILLQVSGESTDVKKLEKAINSLEDIRVKTMGLDF